MKTLDIASHADRMVAVVPGLWAYAQLLAEARVESNEGRRAEHRDRGAEKNLLGDVRGAFCELFLYQLLLQTPGSEDALAHVARHIFNPRGGGEESGPDLEFFEGTRRVCLDVRSFDCDPGKRYFAINAQKHDVLAGQCDFYLCLLVPPYGRRAYVSKLVPYCDVEEWERRSLGRYGDPSRNLPILPFLERYASSGPDLGALWCDRHEPDRIAGIAQRDSVRGALTKHFPSLGPFLLRRAAVP